MTINDRIKGAIYGMALGDALGLGSEFMTQAEIRTYYPGGLTDFSQFVRDAHRSSYVPGSWTNDTEIILRLTEAIYNDGKPTVAGLARAFRKWYLEAPEDVVPVYRAVVGNPEWEYNPLEECHRIWRERGVTEATNEALNRALLIALLSVDDNDIMRHSRFMVALTHDDTRCIASTAVVAKYLRDLLLENSEPSPQELENFCRQIDSRTIPYIKLAGNPKTTIADLELDDEDTSWYTRKTMAITLWCMWQSLEPAEILDSVVNAGGDADTNASLVMALAGAKYGYYAIPDLKNNLKNRSRLEEAAEKLEAIYERTHGNLSD